MSYTAKEKVRKWCNVLMIVGGLGLMPISLVFFVHDDMKTTMWIVIAAFALSFGAYAVSKRFCEHREP